MAEPTLYEQALSQFMQGFPAPPPIKIRPSASVVPWRLGAGGRVEVFWVKRSPKLGVLGGWHAFPGGGISKEDHSLEIRRPPVVTTDLITSFPLYDLADVGEDLSPAIVACALRELFEETGLLLASMSGSPLSTTALQEGRHRVLAGDTLFGDWLSHQSLELDATRLVFAGRWLTPPIAPMRFDTRFFLLQWPGEESMQPHVEEGELSHGEWIAAADALERWVQGNVLAAPPTLHFLDILAKEGPAKGIGRLVQHGLEPIHPNRRFLEVRPGITPIPLITPTLPPARETISYLVGKDEMILVDVGSPFESEIERLVSLLEHFQSEFGKKLKAIWLTHHHPDHVWGVNLLRSRIDVPVMAHPVTAQLVEQMGIKVDATLDDDQVVVLAGDPPLTIRVLHTPGHAKGHISLWEESARSVIAGDLVAGNSTIMIDPPDGDMDEYLASLERVASLSPKTMFPSHGPVINDATSWLRQLIKHRLEREDSIEQFWNEGYRSLPELVARAYTDVSPALHPFAERQTLAHLVRLERHGRIENSLSE